MVTVYGAVPVKLVNNPCEGEVTFEVVVVVVAEITVL